MTRRLTRREFLVRGAEAGLAVAAAGLAGVAIANRGDQPRRWDASAYPPPGAARVAVVRAATYDGDLEGTVQEGLAAVGADLAGRHVLLKPNLVEYDAGTVINTDPRLVAATVLAARRLGAASVTVGEGPGHRRDTEYVAAASGLLDALGAVEAPFVDLNNAALVRRPLATRYTDLGELWLPEPVTGADVVISMPKMKTHHWGGATLSLKNCFGCVPGRVYGWPKNVLHWQGLDASIIDVAAAVRPAYAIVDGIVAMEGDGPIRGTPTPMGVLVFGDDPVATDTVGARLMGLDPERLVYLAEAARFLGQGRWERITHTGEDAESEARAFALLDAHAHLRMGAPAQGTAGPSEG